MFETFVTCPFCRAATSKNLEKAPTFRVSASARISSFKYNAA
jgi:hypothetical protein